MRKILVLGVILGVVLLSQPVLAAPGISVTIEVVDQITGGADLSAEYNVKVESITFEEEDVVLTIRPANSAERLSGEQAADISWFDWTSQSFSLLAGDIEEFPLHATLPAGVSEGYYRFVAEGIATIPGEPFAQDADSKEIVVVIEETIPEFTTIAIPVAAIFGIILLIRRRKQK